MKRHVFLIFVCAVLAGSLLFGCMGPILPLPEPPPSETESPKYDLTGTANYVPGQLEEDPYPLFVGARWLYRNAAKYWSPQISASGLLESEVVAVVQGDGEHCYVLQTHYSNGPDEFLYIHRTKNAVAVRGSRPVAAPGAQTTFSLNPKLAFLELPLAEDLSWELPFSGRIGKALVFHREVVAIESGEVRTLLDPYPAIFLGAWRVHYELPESSPRLYGGPVQFLWFAPGVGVVKHVLNSVNYELAEFRLAEEVVCLEDKDAGKPVQAPNGGLVIIQLRGGSPDPAQGWAWSFENNLELDSALELISADFYEDIAEESDAATYVFRFRALEVGDRKSVV